MTDSLPRPVHTVFTTREGGVSRGAYASFNLGAHVGDDAADVQANRALLARSVGLSPDSFVWMDQVHSATVAVVEGRVTSPIAATDAVVTTQPGLALTVLVADCTPVLLADAHSGVIGAAHAGRQGARDGIVPATVAAMRELGAQPERLRVWLGPAAAGERYEVPEEMAADMEERLPGSRTRTSWGTWGVDVRAGLRRQLADLGVRQVSVDKHCTIRDAEYFSYRGDGGTTGRQAGVIWMEDNR